MIESLYVVDEDSEVLGRWLGLGLCTGGESRSASNA